MLLIDPKYDHNVGAAVRACAVFGARFCYWTGDRVLGEGDGGFPKGYRLPREERMRDYQRVVRTHYNPEYPLQWIDSIAKRGWTPVAVEVLDSSESLEYFEHPQSAMYIFGPEDGSLPGWAMEACHRFVTIPSTMRTPLNLAAATNVVLYDRLAKRRMRDQKGQLVE